MKIVFATHNPGKLTEMRKMLPGFEVKSAEEAGVAEEAIEDGKTFADNALKKAHFVSARTGEWTVADDSGLCVDALGGEPGVYSARWLDGREGWSDLIDYLLFRLKDVPAGKRGAYFECAAALAAPDGRHWIFGGRIDGTIADGRRGRALPNLPYDVIFIPEGHGRTFAEMSENEKNSLSHRGRAFARLREFLSRPDALSGKK